jgi:hypothetical protein
LEFVDDDHRKPIRDQCAQSRTALKQVRRSGREEIEAIEAQLIIMAVEGQRIWV